MQTSLKDINHDSLAILAPPNTPSVSHRHEVSIPGMPSTEFVLDALGRTQAYEHPVAPISFKSPLVITKRTPHECGSSPEEGKGRSSSRESNSHAASGEGEGGTHAVWICTHACSSAQHA